MTKQAASSQLDAHYANYFASERDKEWTSLGAIAKAHNVVELCSEIGHESVLDIGAGDGSVLHLLDSQGFGTRLFAVDISESGLAGISQRKWGRLIEAKRFDGYHVSYPDKTFDLVILSHVVEHVEHPRLLLYEAARVAQYVFVEVPLELRWRNGLLRKDFVLDATGHIN